MPLGLDSLFGILRVSNKNAPNNARVLSLAQLPKELIWAIVERVPEAVCELRLTCRLLRTIVDEFVHQQRLNMALVSDLVFQYEPPGVLPPGKSPRIITAQVPKRFSSMYERRLKLALDSQFRPGRKNESRSSEVNSYTWHWTPFLSNEFKIIMGCSGTKVGRVILEKFHGENLRMVAEELSALEFTRMNVDFDTLTKQDLDTLLKMIKEHGVEHLALSVAKVGAFDSEQALLELSSHLKSLCLDQRFDHRSEKAQFLFGLETPNWHSILIRMFSGKLDALCIENPYYRHFLTSAGSKMLIEKLPNLDKKIWFQTTHKDHEREFQDQVNGHFVQACTRMRCGYLTIKHRLRKDYSTCELNI